ncbi:IGEB protein, partial [Urocynchramus pylzowi]|nr:IGEB protein [Urocynchramus pylzowi]
IRHVRGIPHSPTGQAIVERANRTLKEYLRKQKMATETDVNKGLNTVLFTLNYLSLTEGRERPPVVIHHQAIEGSQTQVIPGLQDHYKNMTTGNWEGP